MVKAFENIERRVQITSSVDLVPIFNTLVENFNTLPLENITEVSELITLVVNPEELMCAKLPQSEAKIFGISVRPKKAIDMLDLDISGIKVDPSDRDMLLKAVGTLQNFCTIKGNEVAVDQKRLAKYLDQETYTHLTGERETVFKEYQQLIDTINAFIDKYPAADIRRMFKYNLSNGKNVFMDRGMFEQLH